MLIYYNIKQNLQIISIRQTMSKLQIHKKPSHAFNTCNPKREQIETPLGVVRIIGVQEPAPIGWRVLTIQQGMEIKQHINKLLTQWAIVAFKKGKLDGWGYGNGFGETYGGECGQKFIVSMPQINITAVYFLQGLYQNWDADLVEYSVLKLQAE